MLRGFSSLLDAPLAAALANEPAERVVDCFLRVHRELGSEQRLAVKEAIYGVAVWRRRLAWHAAPSPPVLSPVGGEGGRRQRPRDPSLSLEGRRSGSVSLASTIRRAFPLSPGRERAGERSSLLVSCWPRSWGPRRCPRRGGGARLAGRRPAVPRPPPEDPALRFSVPDWLWATLQREAGGEAAALADALNLPGPIALRPNLLRTTPEALEERLAAKASPRGRPLVPSARIVTSPRPNLYGLAAEREALSRCRTRRASSSGRSSAARPGRDRARPLRGRRWEDAPARGCGGPERDGPRRRPGPRQRLERLAARARAPVPGAIVRIRRHATAGLRVDAALVDAPCSELGVLRRGPDLRFRLDPATSTRPSRAAAEAPRRRRSPRPSRRPARLRGPAPFRREENEDVALAFEGEHPAFAREEVRRRGRPRRLRSVPRRRVAPRLMARADPSCVRRGARLVLFGCRVSGGRRTGAGAGAHDSAPRA